MIMVKKDSGAEPKSHSFCQWPNCKLMAIIEISLTNHPSHKQRNWVALCSRHKGKFLSMTPESRQRVDWPKRRKMKHWEVKQVVK